MPHASLIRIRTPSFFKKTQGPRSGKTVCTCFDRELTVRVTSQRRRPGSAKMLEDAASLGGQGSEATGGAGLGEKRDQETLGDARLRESVFTGKQF